MIGNGESNVWRNSAELLVSPQLANQATTWYLADTSRPIKPLVFQQRKAPEFVSRTDLASDNVFHSKTFEFGVDSRGAAGYSLWFLMARAIA
jgi:phage major head subunit gpT-like protein